MNMWHSGARACVAVLFGTAGLAMAASAYDVQKLPVDWSHDTFADAINASGWTAGSAARRLPAGEFFEPVLWRGTVPVNLDPLADAPIPQGGYATSINAAGHVGGVLSNTRATLWVDAQAIDLGPGIANDVNDQDQVVGATLSGEYHAMLWQGGQAQPLLELPNAIGSYANAINNRSEIVGYVKYEQSDAAVVWVNGQPKDLPVPPGTRTSRAIDINDSGVIVGVTCDATLCHATRWVAGQPEWLPGPPEAVPDAINNRGEIVGQVRCPDPDPSVPPMCAVLWRDGTYSTLNDLIARSSAPAIHFYDATGINDRGQISAVGVDDTYPVFDAFVLTPIEPVADPVVPPIADPVTPPVADPGLPRVAAVIDQLASLFARVTGVGPGKALSSKIRSLQERFAASDLSATCSLSRDFAAAVKAQAGKKIVKVVAAGLVEDVERIRASLGCST